MTNAQKWIWDHVGNTPVLRRATNGITQYIWKPRYKDGFHLTAAAKNINDFGISAQWWAYDLVNVFNHASHFVPALQCFEYEEYRDEKAEERQEKWDLAVQPVHDGFGGVWSRP